MPLYVALAQQLFVLLYYLSLSLQVSRTTLPGAVPGLLFQILDTGPGGA